MTFNDVEQSFSRITTTVVELTVDGDITGTETFRFGPKGGAPLTKLLGVDVRSTLLRPDIGGRPNKIEPDKALTQRSRLTMRFADEIDPPDFDASKFTITSGSTFWRRLILVQPDLVGSTVEIKRGYVDTSLGLSDFVTIFKGRVEDFNFETNTDFTLIAKDILALNDFEIPRQIGDNNLLNETLTAGDPNITVDRVREFTDPATLPSKDFFPVIMEIQPDSIPNVILSTASWTASTKRLNQSGSFSEYTFVRGDQIFLSHASITDGLFEINQKISNDEIELVQVISNSNLSNVVSEPQEAIIIASYVTATNTATVQENRIVRSEEFDNASWIKTGGTSVTADSAISPFGGDAAAERIDFAAVADRIEQDSGDLASAVTYTFSVWLRGVVDTTSPSISPPYTITLDLIRSDSSELASNQVTVTADWQRFDLTKTFAAGGGTTAVVRIRRDTGDGRAVFAFGAQLERASSRGFYAATASTSGVTAGRGAFGTTAAAHVDNSPLAETIPYRLHLSDSGVHPVFILRDLVNRAQIAPADVDQNSFDREFAFIEDTQLRRSGAFRIRKPRKLGEHVKEVREQALLDLWTSELGLVNTRFSFRQNVPGVQTKTITDAENILFRSASYAGNKESRLTEVYVYFDPDPTNPDPNEPEDFNKVIVAADVGVALASGPKAKIILSKWIFRDGEATATSGRLVSRFKRGARIATWGLDLKDAGAFDLGDVVELDSEDVPVKSGTSAVRGRTNWQVIQKRFLRGLGRIETKGLEFSGLRYAIISPDEDLETAPDPFPDFPVASAAERLFGFIGDSAGLVNAGTESGYFIL